MSDTISANHVVGIHYTLRDDKKEVLDSSEGQEPLLYLHGHSQIVPGLENALTGKKLGEKLSVSISPQDGYGEYDPKLTSVAQRQQFPNQAQLEVGALFEFSNAQGHPVVVRVTELEGDSVTVDANHPLAGQNLHFDVEIVSIRPATKSELDHGHAHEGDGHHH
ncbi:MAG: peptidylprolyl isomerase [Proteobacteria bacterium]|nr:peptidylprolyl isomerase [Pseudomonadota bacterium]